MGRKQLRVYLSGGMEYARNEGVNWRNELEDWIRQNLKHSVFNPNAESAKYLAKRFPNGDFRKLRGSNPDKFTEIVRGIVYLDSHEIATRSDYVICFWDYGAQKGAGTKGEVTIARFFQKPVYLVTRFKHSNIPAWVLGCTTKIFPSFHELKGFLLTEYQKKSV